MQLVRLAKFGMVGCTGIGIDFSVTWLCKEKLKWNKYVANSTGFSFAVVNNYLLNRYYTFQNNDPGISLQFLKFLLISMIGLALSTGLLFLIQKNTRLNFYISKAIVIGLVFIWNYSINSLFTFHY
ncbi:MAG: GtrA family protein [Ferruginibacter sp.]